MIPLNPKEAYNDAYYEAVEDGRTQDEAHAIAEEARLRCLYAQDEQALGDRMAANREGVTR